MEEAAKIDWQTILWVAGGVFTFFFGIITGLLAWIGVMQKEARTSIFVKLEKHDEEIHELALQNRETLTIIKHKLKIK